MRRLLPILFAVLCGASLFGALAERAEAGPTQTCRYQNRYYAGFYGWSTRTVYEADIEVLNSGFPSPAGGRVFYWIGMYNNNNGSSDTGLQVGFTGFSGSTRIDFYSERLVNGVYEPRQLYGTVGYGSAPVNHFKVELVGGYVVGSINGLAVASIFIGTQALRSLQSFQEDYVPASTDCSGAESRFQLSAPHAEFSEYTHLPYVLYRLSGWSHQIWQGYDNCCYLPGEPSADLPEAQNEGVGFDASGSDPGQIEPPRTMVGIPGMPLRLDVGFDIESPIRVPIKP